MSVFETAPDEKGILKRIEDCKLTGGEVLDLLTALPNLKHLNLGHTALKSLPV